MYGRACGRVFMYKRGGWSFRVPEGVFGVGGEIVFAVWGGNGLFLEIRSYKFLFQERKGVGSIDLSTRGYSIVFLHASVTKNGKNENRRRVCLVL